MTIGGNWSNAGTFTNGNNTVTFNSTSAGKTITTGGSNFDNITFNGVGGGWTLQDAFDATGNLTITNGTLNANAQPMTIGGNWSNAGTFTNGNNTVTFNSTSAGKTITTGGSNFDNLIFNGVGGGWTLEDGFTATGNFTITNGALNANAEAMTIGGNWSDAGTFTPAGNSVTFNGSALQTIDSGNQSFYNILNSNTATLQLTGHALTTSNNFTNSASIFNLNSFGFSVSGALSNPGTIQLIGSEAVSLTHGNDTAEGTWKYVGNGDTNPNTYTINDFGATDYYNLLIASIDSNDTYQLTGALGVAGAMTVSHGTFNANGQTNTVTGLTTISGGTYQASSVLQSLNGGLTVSGGTFSGSSGNVTTTNVAISSGLLTAPSGTFDVSGNWDNTGGTFNAGSNSVTLTGSGMITSGTGSFNNLNINASGTYTVTDGITAAGNFTQTSGTFVADPTDTTFSVTKIFSLQGGAFNRFTGLGTGISPYYIYDVYGLQGMGDYLSSTFQLANNIDASATSNWTGGFNPVGNSATKFTGLFNGSYFNISSLYIDLPATNDVGLFGYTNGATIENAGLLGNNITGQNEVGSLVGYNTSTSITNSYATGGVSGSGNDIGALVGYNGNTSSIATSYATANVSGSNNVGGLVGNNNSSSIANTYATGP